MDDPLLGEREKDYQVLALLTRSLWQRVAEAVRYIHRAPMGRKQRVVSTQVKLLSSATHSVNSTDAGRPYDL
ncbi:hypothetical protein ACVIGA_003596 [Bradyrhizobium sp. USDA 3240]